MSRTMSLSGKVMKGISICTPISSMPAGAHVGRQEVRERPPRQTCCAWLRASAWVSSWPRASLTEQQEGDDDGDGHGRLARVVPERGWQAGHPHEVFRKRVCRTPPCPPHGQAPPPQHSRRRGCDRVAPPPFPPPPLPPAAAGPAAPPQDAPGLAAVAAGPGSGGTARAAGGELLSSERRTGTYAEEELAGEVAITATCCCCCCCCC